MSERPRPQVLHRVVDDPTSPVTSLPNDVDDKIACKDGPPVGVGLGMSGGGYRAMLFHLGSLWRLNELGYLPKLTRVSSVSGGSITSARLGQVWNKLAFDRAGVAQAFTAEVVEPIRELASHTIDLPAVVVGAVLPFITIADRIEKAYRKYVFGDAVVADLPGGAGAPRFVINAASVQTGALFRFEKQYVADWRIGVNRKAPAKLPLAKAVAASSAFAPFLSPVVLELEPADFDVAGADLDDPAFRSRVVLTDGGNYDNLGLETIYKRCKTVLVSDAVGGLPADESPYEDWVRHGVRAVELLLNQIVSLRKRQLIDALGKKPPERTGAYWSVRSELANYQLPDAWKFDQDLATRMAQTPTRLEELDDGHQKDLINWGYVICDTAMRTHLETTAAKPARLPYERSP